MTTADTSRLPKLLLVGVASATLAIGASTAASASTGTTEPADDMTAHTEAEHTMDTTAGSLAVDGSAEASSPEAEAFCNAEVAAEAAVTSPRPPEQIGPAVGGSSAAAPEEIAEPMEHVVTSPVPLTSEPECGSVAPVIEYMRANCGFAELGVVASRIRLRGSTLELPAGPVIVSLENIGQELHEFHPWSA